MSLSPDQSSIPIPPAPVAAKRLTATAMSSGSCPYPFSASTLHGTDAARTSSSVCCACSSLLTSPAASRRPIVDACPLLVVAMAAAPAAHTAPAVPASATLTMTKVPERCSSMNRVPLSILATVLLIRRALGARWLARIGDRHQEQCPALPTIRHRGGSLGRRYAPARAPYAGTHVENTQAFPDAHSRSSALTATTEC